MCTLLSTYRLVAETSKKERTVLKQEFWMRIIHLPTLKCEGKKLDIHEHHICFHRRSRGRHPDVMKQHLCRANRVSLSLDLVLVSNPTLEACECESWYYILSIIYGNLQNILLMFDKWIKFQSLLFFFFIIYVFFSLDTNPVGQVFGFSCFWLGKWTLMQRKCHCSGNGFSPKRFLGFGPVLWIKLTAVVLVVFSSGINILRFFFFP